MSKESSTCPYCGKGLWWCKFGHLYALHCPVCGTTYNTLFETAEDAEKFLKGDGKDGTDVDVRN